MFRKAVWGISGLVIGMSLALGIGALAQTSGADGGLTAEVADGFVTAFDSVFNESLGNADALFSDDFVAHLPLAPELDREGWKNYVALFQASFPDIRQTTYASSYSGDQLVVRVSYDGTFTGAPFFGAAANGAPVSMNGIGIFKFVDGVPVENWAVVDVAGVLAQVGVWPPPAETAGIIKISTRSKHLPQ